MEYVLQWYVLHVSLILIGDIWSTYDKWGVVTEWRRKYFSAICSTCLSPATPELDQFRLGWPKNQFPHVRSGTKSRSRSLFTKTLPSPRASRSVFVLLCWSFGSLDPFLERKPRKLLRPSMLFSMRPNRESTECGNLYHVAVVLDFLSSPISLAEIWVIYIFGWLDLSQILRILAAFSLWGSL